MSQAEVLRTILFVDAIGCIALFAGVIVGPVWSGRKWDLTRPSLWAFRISMLGALGILIYITSGQAKAFDHHIPFDGYSWVGLVAATVFNIGMVAIWAVHALVPTQESRPGRR